MAGRYLCEVCCQRYDSFAGLRMHSKRACDLADTDEGVSCSAEGCTVLVPTAMLELNLLNAHGIEQPLTQPVHDTSEQHEFGGGGFDADGYESSDTGEDAPTGPGQQHDLLLNMQQQCLESEDEDGLDGGDPSDQVHDEIEFDEQHEPDAEHEQEQQQLADADDDAADERDQLYTAAIVQKLSGKLNLSLVQVNQLLATLHDEQFDLEQLPTNADALLRKSKRFADLTVGSAPALIRHTLAPTTFGLHNLGINKPVHIMTVDVAAALRLALRSASLDDLVLKGELLRDSKGKRCDPHSPSCAFVRGNTRALSLLLLHLVVSCCIRRHVLCLRGNCCCRVSHKHVGSPHLMHHATCHVSVSVARRVYGPVHTGTAWHAAEAAMARLLTAGVFMLALAGYSDKTMTRTIGQITYWPMVLVILNMSADKRQQVQGHINIGFIPCLKQVCDLNKAHHAMVTKRLAAAVWDIVFKELNVLRDAAQPLTITLSDGSKLLVRPALLAMIGDHLEQADHCGVSSAWNCAMPCPRCQQPFEDTDQFYTQKAQVGDCCKPRDRAQMLELTAKARPLKPAPAKKLLKPFSLTGVRAPLLHYEGFGITAGILQRAPFDFMHQVMGGAAKDIPNMIIDATKGVKRQPDDRTTDTSGILLSDVCTDQATSRLTSRLRCVMNASSFDWTLLSCCSLLAVLKACYWFLFHLNELNGCHISCAARSDQCSMSVHIAM